MKLLSGIIKHLLYTTLAILMLVSSPLSAQNDKSGKKKISASDRTKVDAMYVDASRAKIKGNLDEAASLYVECIKIDAANDAAMYELAGIYNEQKRYSDAVFFAKSAAELNKKNIWYQLLLARLYEKTKAYPEAIGVYNQIIKTYPERTEYQFDLASTYLFSGKVNEAIKIYDKIENIIGINPDVSLQKEKLYMQLNKPDKAMGELEKLVDKFPKDPRYLGMIADLYMQRNMEEKALEIYNKILVIDPGNGLVHLSLADYYRKKGEKDKAFDELKSAFSNQQLDIETKLQILGSYYLISQQTDALSGQSLTLGRILAETHPKDARAHTVYGDFLSHDKKYMEAREQYRASVALDKKGFAVWQQMIVMDSELKDTVSLLKDTKDALELFPTQPVFYYFNGVAYVEMEHYREAVEALSAGVKLVVDNDLLKVQFLGNLGDAYNKLKEYKLSDESYDKALVIRPKDTYILNNYSYYLSVRGENLEKAETMSKLSNELAPDNASYLDTYGWILYKMGKYQDAKIWIDKALLHGGQGSDAILEHQGDILFRLNDIEGAKTYWQKAKKAGNGSEFLDKKILDGKLYE